MACNKIFVVCHEVVYDKVANVHKKAGLKSSMDFQGKLLKKRTAIPQFNKKDCSMAFTSSNGQISLKETDILFA